VIYAAFLTLVAVSPEDAQGNVAKWAKVVHIELWPDRLTGVGALVTATFVVMGFYVWWWWRHRGQSSKDTPPAPSDGPPPSGPGTAPPGPGGPHFDFDSSDVEMIDTKTKGGQALRAKDSQIKTKKWRHDQ